MLIPAMRLHHMPQQSHMSMAALHLTMKHNKATCSFHSSTAPRQIQQSTTKATCGLSDVTYADVVFV